MRGKLNKSVLAALLATLIFASVSLVSCNAEDAAVSWLANVIVSRMKDPVQTAGTTESTDGALTDNYSLNCGNYTSAEVIDYFIDTAFYTESNGYIGVIRKITAPVTYSVRGDFTDSDIAQIQYVTDFLNGIDGFPGISECTGGTPDIDIVFGTLEYLETYEDMYENSYGSVSFTWDGESYAIMSSYVRIVSDMVEQYDRNHIILEEIIQGMGLGNDMWTYEESLFYEGWNAPQTVPFIDELLIRALYCEDITPGMTEDEAIPVLCCIFGADEARYRESKISPPGAVG